jgi:hypothetical protein
LRIYKCIDWRKLNEKSWKPFSKKWEDDVDNEYEENFQLKWKFFLNNRCYLYCVDWKNPKLHIKERKTSLFILRSLQLSLFRRRQISQINVIRKIFYWFKKFSYFLSDDDDNDNNKTTKENTRTCWLIIFVLYEAICQLNMKLWCFNNRSICIH